MFADEELVAAAAQAAERLRLRAYAIQIAAASRSGCDLFLCSGTELLAAANTSHKHGTTAWPSTVGAVGIWSGAKPLLD